MRLCRTLRECACEHQGGVLRCEGPAEREERLFTCVTSGPGERRSVRPKRSGLKQARLAAARHAHARTAIHRLFRCSWPHPGALGPWAALLPRGASVGGGVRQWRSSTRPPPSLEPQPPLSLRIEASAPPNQASSRASRASASASQATDHASSLSLKPRPQASSSDLASSLSLRATVARAQSEKSEPDSSSSSSSSSRYFLLYGCKGCSRRI